MAKYVLPIASETELGGIKIGQGLEVEKDGTVNVKGLNEIEDTIKAAQEEVSAGKSLLAVAITEKGVDTEATESFPVMAEKIKQIPETPCGIKQINRVSYGAVCNIAGIITVEGE